VFRTWGDIAYLAATVGAVAFVAMYCVLARWWRSASGRFIMTLSSVMTSGFLFGMIYKIFGPFKGAATVGSVFYTVLAAVIWAAVIGLARIQIKNRVRAR
jgi:hypothetical protein